MEHRQLSLLERGPARVSAFDRLRRVDLGLGAWVDHVPGWVAGQDALFDELHATVPWRSEDRIMYERRVAVPRLVANLLLSEAPPALQQAGALLGARYGASFERVGLALYRDGSDSVAWHRDRPLCNLPRALVAVVSLGGSRRFLMRPFGGGRSIRFGLLGGDLLVMGGTSQRTWEHSVPKLPAAQPRLSIMFRYSWQDDEAAHHGDAFDEPGVPAAPRAPRRDQRRRS